MKLNKTMGRVATTLVATAMLASVAVVPAFAEGDPQLTVGENKDTVSFTKAIDMTNATGAGVPNMTFKFNVTDGAATGDIKAGDADTQIVDEDSTTDGIQISAPNNGQQTTSIDIGFDMTKFSAPGTYSYTLQEVASGVPGMSDDTTKYTLNVVVVNATPDDPNGTYVIQSAALGNGESKTATITDRYTTYDLTLDKTVTGDFGNKNTSFAFTISFDSNDDNAVSFTRSDTNASVSFENSAASVEVSLKHGETVTFTGLPAGVTYNISEAENENDTGYTTTITGNGVNYSEGAEEISGTTANGDVVVNESASDVAVHYENNKASSPATGIVMNVAPYALLVVVAAAGCFVFMRKRRED